MGPRTKTDADKWHGIQDSKLRKQIQDRLAQRARRKRLAENKRASCIHVTVEPPQTRSTSTKRAPEQSLDLLSIPQSTATSSLVPPPITISTHTVYSALFLNGVILGLACGSSTAATSRLPSPNVPESLRPSIIQLESVHFDWIDRFPSSRLRDNMITMSELYSAEDFLADLFTMATFDILPGHMSWDPHGWKATDEFKRKWGFLLAAYPRHSP